MTVASRIGLMNAGKLAQVATPPEIYENPNSRFVADFIGDVNIIEGKAGDSVRRDGEEFRQFRRTGGDGAFLARDSAPVPAGETCWLAVRPEKIAISKTKAGRRGQRHQRPRPRHCLCRQSFHLPRAARRRHHRQGAGGEPPPHRQSRDHLGRRGLALLHARRGNRAGAVSGMGKQPPLARHRRSISVARHLLPGALPDRPEDLAVRLRCRAAALCSGAGFQPGTCRAEGLLLRARFRNLPLSRFRSALHQRLPVQPEDRARLHGAGAARRIPACLWHGPRARQVAAAAGDAGDPAVLDLLPHPRLRLDRHPAHRGPAQPVPAVDGRDQRATGDHEHHDRRLYRHRLFLPAVHGAADLLDAGEDGRIHCWRRRSTLAARASPPSGW